MEVADGCVVLTDLGYTFAKGHVTLGLWGGTNTQGTYKELNGEHVDGAHDEHLVLAAGHVNARQRAAAVCGDEPCRPAPGRAGAEKGRREGRDGP